MRGINAQNAFSVCCTDIRFKHQSSVDLQMQLACVYHSTPTSRRSLHSTLLELALRNPSTTHTFSHRNGFNLHITNKFEGSLFVACTRSVG